MQSLAFCVWGLEFRPASGLEFQSLEPETKCFAWWMLGFKGLRFGV